MSAPPPAGGPPPWEGGRRAVAVVRKPFFPAVNTNTHPTCFGFDYAPRCRHCLPDRRLHTTGVQDRWRGPNGLLKVGIVLQPGLLEGYEVDKCLILGVPQRSAQSWCICSVHSSMAWWRPKRSIVHWQPSLRLG